MKSTMASTTIILFLSFSIVPLLTIVRANNDYNVESSSVHCPPPPPCICNPTPPPPPPQFPTVATPPDAQPPTPPTFQPAQAPNDQPPPPPHTTTTTSTTDPTTATSSKTLPPLSPPQAPPPPTTAPPLSPLLGNVCSKNDTELKICAEILSISDGLLTTGRAEPCCSIIRNVSDVDAVTCLWIPQGFSCPGPSPTTPPPPLPPKTLPPLSPPQTTPPPPPPLSPLLGNVCSKNDTELKICAEILSISDGLLTTGRAEPCCSIIRNVSDVDAVTCLCKSVGARPFSLSPNFGIFFKVCGRRIPQGFTCPGPSPTTPPPPLPPKTLPPLSPPQTTPPPPPPLSPLLGNVCSKNDTELKICAEILSISDGLLTTGRAEPCCSTIRNVSDVDAVTCLCKSVGARRFSLSPNFGIFFKVCGRRIPQGFSCP